MPIASASRISTEQYRALQSPVTLPSQQQLFDQIVETLVTKGLAKHDVADPFRARIPNGLFALVPPQPAERDLNHLVGLIEVNGKKGVNYLDLKQLTDTVAVPVGPYLILNVEDGKGRLNTKPSISEGNILREGRSPFTTWEGIVHAILFPEIFTSHNMDLCGSRDGSKVVPSLFLRDGQPELSAGWNDIAGPGWGAPSCGSRMGA